MTDNIDDEDYDFWHSTISIIAGANMVSEEKIREGIEGLNSLIDTGYYDNKAGNELMKQVVSYLTEKLK